MEVSGRSQVRTRSSRAAPRPLRTPDQNATMEAMVEILKIAGDIRELRCLENDSFEQQGVVNYNDGLALLSISASKECARNQAAEDALILKAQIASEKAVEERAELDVDLRKKRAELAELKARVERDEEKSRHLNNKKLGYAAEISQRRTHSADHANKKSGFDDKTSAYQLKIDNAITAMERNDGNVLALENVETMTPEELFFAAQVPFDNTGRNSFAYASDLRTFIQCVRNVVDQSQLDRYKITGKRTIDQLWAVLEEALDFPAEVDEDALLFPRRSITPVRGAGRNN